MDKLLVVHDVMSANPGHDVWFTGAFVQRSLGGYRLNYGVHAQDDAVGTELAARLRAWGN